VIFLLKILVDVRSVCAGKENSQWSPVPEEQRTLNDMSQKVPRLHCGF
jgi:hypothetical protein